MRIAIDAMGGDHAPDEIIAGALEAIPQLDKDDEVVLVGPQELVESKLAELKYKKGRVTVVDAPDVVAWTRPPSRACARSRRARSP